MSPLVFLTVALAPLLAPAVPADPCDLAGTYLLDREPLHANVIASMNDSLDDLGERPEDDDSFARVEWDARRTAYQEVLAQARAGEIVPRMEIELKADGSFEHSVLREDKEDHPRYQGRWAADDACQTMTVDIDSDDQEEPSIVRIEGDRLVFEDATETRRGALNGVAFDRVR